MKFKIAGLASTALLLLSPISGALTTIAEPSVVQAENNWDYDTANPGLGEYDQLLQNAGPSDGIVDWYPAKGALGNNPTGQELVKQLIELSIATNNANSNARNVLFNDTTGVNDHEGYEDTYNKYPLAFGFIAQLLDFNNEKTGLGAQLAQGAVSSDENDPLDPRNGQSVITAAVSQKPRKGQGHTIADVLGKAFFGNADDAYAQIYINGYDNVAQNEANIIRESTSSITIVAVSKLTGRKATAIFKLNNKTLPRDVINSKLNNYVDQSSYALDNEANKIDIAGLNMTTAPQSTIDHLPLTKEASYWVSNKDGGGTIVVPRGTTAQQIAALIAKKQVEGNNTLAGSAPMKAIQAVDGTNAKGEAYRGQTHSYSHFYEGVYWEDAPHLYRRPQANWGDEMKYNKANEVTFGINGPARSDSDQYREYNNVFNADLGAKSNSSFSIVSTDPSHQTTDGWFGGTDDNKAGHMLDTNEMFNGTWQNSSAATIPDYVKSEGDPFSDSSSLPHAPNMKVAGKDFESKVAGVSEPRKLSNVGKVKHLFKPSSYFKEAYDANHFVNNSPQIQDQNVNNIAQQIANNGSFSKQSADGEIKKSFSYEAPVSSWLYKSYNNPYSTVVSSAGAQTVDGEPLAGDGKNSTIQPQEKVDLANPNQDVVDYTNETTVNLSNIAQVFDTGIYPNERNRSAGFGSGPVRSYYYIGYYDQNVPGVGRLQVEIDKSSNQATLSLLAGTKGTLVKYGAIGTDGENVTGGETGHPNSNDATQWTGNGFYGSTEGQSRKFNVNLPNSDSIRLELDGHFGKDATSDKQVLAIRENAKMWGDSQYFVQTWDKNTRIKNADGTYEANPAPLIYNKNVLDPTSSNLELQNYSKITLGKVDSPNFESKYYLDGVIEFDNTTHKIVKYTLNDHIVQSAASKRAYFNSNLYNNPNGALTQAGTRNNSRFFVSQDFAIGPVSSDMINDAGPVEAKVTIPELGEVPAVNKDETSAAQILKLAVMYNDPTGNKEANKRGNNGNDVDNEFTEAAGYKLVSIGDAASKQGVSEATLAEEVAKVTGKSAREVKNTKWVEATLPRLKRNAGKARINVVIYDQDKTAISTPAKAETKPSFSTTDVSTGNDPFNVNLRPYTTTYDDGAVLKGADVPQSFQNLLSNTLVAGNADLVDHPNRLEEVLVSAFLNSWQQNDGSFNQTDTAVGVNSPLYLYGGFGISNSDTKNSYSQWPNGYTTNTGDYLTATSHYSGDFYRGGKDLQLVRGGTVKGIPASALKADVSKVDLSKAGTYPVVYTYTNPNNTKDSASITVPVTVKDAAAPVFAFQGGSDVTLHVGESFDRTAYKVVGNWQIFNKSEGDYNQLVNYEGIAKNSKGEPDVTISGDVDTNTPGVYRVTYEATNLSGIKAKMVRKINVLPKPTGPDQSDWTVSVMKGVGYINYTPGYGINVWNAPAGIFTGQRLLHGTSWKIFQKAVNRQGKVYYNVGKNQWLDGAYVSFTPVSALQHLNGIVTINYVQGYGVNLWKAPSATASYYDRKLPHGSKWRVMGQQDGFYNVGKNQWIQAKYAKFQAR